MDREMNAEVVTELVIAPEDAVFWMDRWGHWCNAHGRFQHKKIIDYFHAAIARDEQGYYVSQINGKVLEKVYFRYEDTALFVFDVLTENGMTLVLNTRQHLTLDPESLFIRDDCLYVRNGDEVIKFNQSSMLKISRFFTHEEGGCFLTMQGKQTAIPQHDNVTLPDANAIPPDA